MLKNLLLLRLTIINAIGFVLLAFAGQKGWIAEMIRGDSTGLVYVMAAVFLWSIVSLFIRAAKVSGYLNASKAPNFSPVFVSRVKFMAKQAHLGDVPGVLMTLGLIGTVIGVSMALFGIDQNSLASAEGVKNVNVGLLQGMQVALYTTIVGSILGVWAGINRRILHTATVLMLEDTRGANA